MDKNEYARGLADLLRPAVVSILTALMFSAARSVKNGRCDR